MGMSFRSYSSPTEIGCGNGIINKFIKQKIGRTSVDFINIAHININGLHSKIDEFKHHMYNCPIDVLAISETHLKPHILSKSVDIEGFRLIRNDRAGKKRCGECVFI